MKYIVIMALSVFSATSTAEKRLSTNPPKINYPPLQSTQQHKIFGPPYESSRKDSLPAEERETPINPEDITEGSTPGYTYAVPEEREAPINPEHITEGSTPDYTYAETTTNTSNQADAMQKPIIIAPHNKIGAPVTFYAGSGGTKKIAERLPVPKAQAQPLSIKEPSKLGKATNPIAPQKAIALKGNYN